jgi:hypothetical protein
MEFTDEIVEIVEVEQMDLIDIEVSGDHLFWANGILTHNSSIETMGEFDQSHTAGGISKINTCDNAIALYAPPAYKERGDFEFIFLKTRESTGVGQRVKLNYDNTCMRITNREMTGKEADKPSTYADLRKEVTSKPSSGDRHRPTSTENGTGESDLMARIDGLMARRRHSPE